MHHASVFLTLFSKKHSIEYIKLRGMCMIYKKFFGAVNSAYGFKSYFDKLFFTDDIKRRFIIKGGAGTGKSTFLKALAAGADKCGHDAELYYCSSDPKSLDGVIIRDIGVCALDATAPHAYDCKYVGCVDTLLDVTRFLNGKALLKMTDDVKRLAKESSHAYKSGYKSLSAAGKLIEELYESGREHIDENKLMKTARRLTKNTGKNEKELIVRIVSSINANGKTSLTEYFSNVSRAYHIEDKYVSAPILLKKITECAHGKVTAFTDPLMPENFEAVYLEETNTLISAEKKLLPEKFTRIAKDKFYDGYYSENKEKIKFQIKLIKALTDMACMRFKNAKESHDALEKINVAAMDFHAMEKWSQKLIKEILSDEKAR